MQNFVRNLFLCCLLSISVGHNSFAFDLDKALDRVNELEASNSSAEDVLKNVVDDKTANIEKLVKDKIDEVSADIQNRQQEIEDTISQVTENVAKFTKIRKKINDYMSMVKIAIIAIVALLVILIVLLIVIWFKFSNINKIIRNLIGFKKLQKDVEQLKQEVAALKAVK